MARAGAAEGGRGRRVGGRGYAAGGAAGRGRECKVANLLGGTPPPPPPSLLLLLPVSLLYTPSLPRSLLGGRGGGESIGGTWTPSTEGLEALPLSAKQCETAPFGSCAQSGQHAR